MRNLDVHLQGTEGAGVIAKRFEGTLRCRGGTGVNAHGWGLSRRDLLKCGENYIGTGKYSLPQCLEYYYLIQRYAFGGKTFAAQRPFLAGRNANARAVPRFRCPLFQCLPTHAPGNGFRFRARGLAWREREAALRPLMC